jgi:hypothetical protein
MAWHDKSPWAAKREQQEAIAKRRDKAVGIIRAFTAGELEADAALNQIVEAWTGEADAVVRVGNVHKPEIQT